MRFRRFRVAVATACGVALTSFGLPVPAGAAAAGVPVSHLDSAVGGAGSVTMTGWAFDRDHLSGERIDVWQTAPGHRAVASTTTTINRPDVNRAYRISGVHGWSVTFAATPGRGTYCAYAINVGTGGNPLIGCRTVTVGAVNAPIGHLDYADPLLGANYFASGWAYDRDGLGSAERIEVWQQNPRVLLGTTTTTVDRPDVNRAFGLTGVHGWEISFAMQAPTGFCIYADNIGPTHPATLIKCVNLADLPPSQDPVRDLSAAVTPNSVALTWTKPILGPVTQLSVYRVAQPQAANTAVKLADLAPGTTSFTDTGLVSGISYAYSVYVSGPGGVRVHSDITATTTLIPCVTVCGWGSGYGAFGLGNYAPPIANHPIAVAGLSAAVAITGLGYETGLALTSDGVVHAWGAGERGQLGNRSMTGSSTPVTVDLTDVIAIAGGSSTGYALRRDGTVWAWGDDGIGGRLGARVHIPNSSVPVQVSRVHDVIAIAAGGGNGFALEADGSVWAWGDNGLGALGNFSGSVGPDKVSGLPTITAISAGWGTAYAVDQGGSVWAWGDNSQGQLGGSTTRATQAVPATIPGLPKATSVSGAGKHALAALQDGTVWAWGDNQFGQIGDGTTIGPRAPTPVIGLSSITAVAGMYNSSFALRNDGTVWSWGHNAHGELGDQTTTDSPSPVQAWGLTGVTSIGGGDNTVYAAHSS